MDLTTPPKTIQECCDIYLWLEQYSDVVLRRVRNQLPRLNADEVEAILSHLEWFETIAKSLHQRASDVREAAETVSGVREVDPSPDEVKPKTRRCKICDERRPLTSEYFRKSRSNFWGYRLCCWECERKVNRERAKRHREHYKLNPSPRPETWHCNGCKTDLPFTEEFFSESAGRKYGLKTKCKECVGNAARERKKHYRLNPSPRPETWHCNHCETDLPFTEEYFHNNAGKKHGLSTRCIKCARKAARYYHAKKKLNPSPRPETWHCNHCETDLPFTEEYFVKYSGGKYGLETKCKKCRRKSVRERGEYYKEYNKLNPKSRPETWHCNHCNTDLPFTEEYFSENAGRKYGLNTKCKECVRKYYRERKEHYKLNLNSRPETWHCTGCNTDLPFNKENFYKNSGSRYGLHTRCKKCTRKEHRAYRAKKKKLAPRPKPKPKTWHCTGCDVDLPFNEEYFHKVARGKYGLKTKCKKCRNKAGRERHAKKNLSPNNQTELWVS